MNLNVHDASENADDDTSFQLTACLPALRIVSVGIIISLVWKVAFFLVFIRIYNAIPLVDSFFPAWLRSTEVAIGAYSAAVVGATLMVVCRSKSWLSWSAVLTVVGSGILCLHQQSYNDVTFLTCCWSAVWCWWFIQQLGQPADALMLRAGLMAHLILSVIFLGGAVGKFTPGYWSGEVFHQIYFEGRNYWLFNWIRTVFDESSLMEISRWYSRFVICTEAACALIWLLPSRIASFIAIAVLCNIALMSNALLFSVLSCLIGLALAALHVPVPAKK